MDRSEIDILLSTKSVFGGGKRAVPSTPRMVKKNQVFIHYEKNMLTGGKDPAPRIARPIIARVVERPFQRCDKVYPIEPVADEVAHDLVNKLTVIKCWTEVMLRRGMATGEGVEYLRNILKAVDSSVTLSEKLHAFGCQNRTVENDGQGTSPASE